MGKVATMTDEQDEVMFCTRLPSVDPITEDRQGKFGEVLGRLHTIGRAAIPFWASCLAFTRGHQIQRFYNKGWRADIEKWTRS